MKNGGRRRDRALCVCAHTCAWECRYKVRWKWASQMAGVELTVLLWWGPNVVPQGYGPRKIGILGKINCFKKSILKCV